MKGHTKFRIGMAPAWRKSDYSRIVGNSKVDPGTGFWEAGKRGCVGFVGKQELI